MGAIQMIITTQPPAQATQLYAEHYTRFAKEDKDTCTNPDITDDVQKASLPTEDSEIQHSDNQDLQGENELASEPIQESTIESMPKHEPQPLQFVDTEGRPSGAYRRKSAPRKDRKHYFYPQIPPRVLGWGET